MYRSAAPRSTPRMDRWDILTFAGLATVGVGLWMIYPPAALICIGAALCFVGWARSPSDSSDSKAGS